MEIGETLYSRANGLISEKMLHRPAFRGFGLGTTKKITTADCNCSTRKVYRGCLRHFFVIQFFKQFSGFLRESLWPSGVLQTDKQTHMMVVIYNTDRGKLSETGSPSSASEEIEDVQCVYSPVSNRGCLNFYGATLSNEIWSMAKKRLAL